MENRVVSIIVVVLVFLGGSFLPAADDSPFRFVVIGDSGCGCDGQEDVAQTMIQWHNQRPYSAVLMVGDNIYGRGPRTRGGHRELFDDRFDDYYQPLLDKGVKFYAALGNHDYETRGGRDLIQDKKRFNILGGRGYYSFTPVDELGKDPLVTFIALNSVTLESDESDPAQVEWLSKTLLESKATWKIPFFHHPIHTPPGAHENSTDFLKRVENVFVAAGVQVTFAGHNHFYARMKPMRDVVHFVTGGGGRRLKTPQPNQFTEVARRAHHFILVELTPAQLEFWAVPTQGRPFDHGIIKKRTVP